MFLISNFRLVLNVVFFLLGDSPASEFYVPTFRNTLFHLHRSSPLVRTNYKDGTECSETSAYKIQTPGNHPQKEYNEYKYTCILLGYWPKHVGGHYLIKLHHKPKCVC
jgi:hypothetical protein